MDNFSEFTAVKVKMKVIARSTSLPLSAINLVYFEIACEVCGECNVDSYNCFNLWDLL